MSNVTLQCVKSKSVTDLAEATADPALDRVVTLDPPPMGQEAPPEPPLPLEGAVGGAEGGHQDEGAVGGHHNPPMPPASESYPEVSGGRAQARSCGLFCCTFSCVASAVLTWQLME